MAINFPSATDIGQTYNFGDSTYIWNGVKWSRDLNIMVNFPINGAFWENNTTINTSYTITENKNAFSAGPIAINNGVIVTVPDGSTWTIV